MTLAIWTGRSAHLGIRECTHGKILRMLRPTLKNHSHGIGKKHAAESRALEEREGEEEEEEESEEEQPSVGAASSRRARGSGCGVKKAQSLGACRRLARQPASILSSGRSQASGWAKTVKNAQRATSRTMWLVFLRSHMDMFTKGPGKKYSIEVIVALKTRYTASTVVSSGVFHVRTSLMKRSIGRTIDFFP
mmetsp:Transcript_65304/g.176486  ORF Transcript_65304/g.176486 Transcript_65304/m.176486 type:complete len:192 (-) Transcript_65304:733-1308(-)